MERKLWIGTSGWSYDHWNGVLYPHGLPAADRLGHYVQRYPTVEVNSTFYRWPPDAAFDRWRQRLPEGFQMTVKAPRGLTHGKRLYQPETWLTCLSNGSAAHAEWRPRRRGRERPWNCVTPPGTGKTFSPGWKKRELLAA